MESNKPTTPPSGNRPLSARELRRATFPQVLRGYDREAVHALLDRVAEWVEQGAGQAGERAPAMREELAKVGERTAGILTAAEEAAQSMLEEATEYAQRLRAEAEDEARGARLNSGQRMDEMVAAAEAKAERMMEDAIARRRGLNQAISSLIERRDEIANDVVRLGEELLDAVDALREADPPEEDDVAREDDGAGEDDDESPEAELEPDPEATELEQTQLDSDDEQTEMNVDGEQETTDDFSTRAEPDTLEANETDESGSPDDETRVYRTDPGR